ncbi:TIGR00297 family protein [soil metagenome]
MTSLIAAAVVPAVFAVLAYRLDMVSKGGAVGGLVVAAAIYATLGWQGFTILALFVIAGSALTRLGYVRKERSGTAEGGGGRRGARNALANSGVAVVCALLAALTAYPEAFAAAFVAALGAAFADTVESEVGQVYGVAPRLITTFVKVPTGTDGAVSLPGTLAGAGAAGLTAFVGLAVGLVQSPGSALLVMVAAFLGTVVDSLIGAVAPRVGNELTNVSCTLVAAALTLLI